MKKTLGLSLVAATLLAGSAVAADAGKISGDVRAFYYSTSTGYGENSPADGAGSALSAGFNALYESPKMEKLSYGLGFGMQSNIMESGVEAGQSVATDQYLDESFMLNQLYVAYDSAIGTIKAGKQTLDTPGAGTDDYRLIPNTFEAVVLINDKAVSNTTLIAAQVAAMSGWDNGDLGLAGYSSMTAAAFGSGVEDNGATVLAAIYGKDALSAQLWSYNILNTTDAGTNEVSAIALNYVELGYGLDLGGMKLDLGAQYKSFAGTAENIASGAEVADYGHTVTGFKAELGTDFGLSALVAMNSVDGESGVINAWGGFPEYAIADEYFLNGFNNKVFTSTKVGAMYEAGDLGVGAYVTSMAGDDTEGTDETATITDIYVNYGEFALVSETQAIGTVSGNDPDDVTVMKLQYTRAF